MRGNDDKALYDYFVGEYTHHFDYWDWSYLEGRRVEMSTGKKQWDYTKTVQAAMKQVRSVLDMRTGSGQVFAELLKEQPVAQAYATEGYAPNLARARQVLTPPGVTVYEVQNDDLPFADNDLELIINRHGSYDLREIRRVLKPDHLFITQQVGDHTNRRIHELLGRQKQPYTFVGVEQKPAWNLDYAVREMREVGWHIVEQKEDFTVTRFYDGGAIVYYLKAIPWEVPDFSVEKYFDRLVEIHHLIQREGYVDVLFHTFFMIARKE